MPGPHTICLHDNDDVGVRHLHEVNEMCCILSQLLSTQSVRSDLSLTKGATWCVRELGSTFCQAETSPRVEEGQLGGQANVPLCAPPVDISVVEAASRKITDQTFIKPSTLMLTPMEQVQHDLKL